MLTSQANQVLKMLQFQKFLLINPDLRFRKKGKA